MVWLRKTMFISTRVPLEGGTIPPSCDLDLKRSFPIRKKRKLSWLTGAHRGLQKACMLSLSSRSYRYHHHLCIWCCSEDCQGSCRRDKVLLFVFVSEMLNVSERDQEKRQSVSCSRRSMWESPAEEITAVWVCLYCTRVWRVLPDAKPVSVTTSHPDQASYRLFVNSHADSFFLLFIYKHTWNTS